MNKPRPKCFVMIPFSKKYQLVLEVIRQAVHEAGLECIVADNTHIGEVAKTIRGEIRQAVLCIAEITERNANVAYELGIADTLGKTVILISKNPNDTFFDVRHWSIKSYQSSAKGLESLKVHLTTFLCERLRRELFSMMLVPPDLRQKEGPFVIAANPLSWRGTKRREGGFRSLTGTQIEYVGVKRLLLEFAALRLSDNELELLNPNDYRDEVVWQDMNLYSLGSPKANPWTGAILAEFNKKWTPKFEFKVDPKSDLGDVKLQVWRDGKRYAPVDSTYSHDFGLIIRGPNPFRSACMITILAGPRGTGTEAACRAATDLDLLMEINGKRDRLSSVNKPFFAVVEMKRDKSNAEADLESLKLIEAGQFKRQ